MGQELAKALESLEKSKFAKMIAFLRDPVRRQRQVRTNNHAERCKRKRRYWEKVRYKWRRRRTLVRYVVLALDRWWKQAFESKDERSPHGKLAEGRPRAKTA